MKTIVLGAEQFVAPFMDHHCHAHGAFTKGRAIALVDIDEEAGSNEILAGVWFEGFNGAAMNMHVAAKPNSYWFSRAFANVCFHYAFVQCGARVVIGLVEESNVRARRFDEKLGFKVETRIKDAAPGGDMLVLTMRKDECRWLHVRGALPLTRIGVN